MRLTPIRTLVLVAALLAVALAMAGGVAHAEDATWTAKFYGNKNLEGSPIFTQQDKTIDFNWGHGSPAPGIVPDDNFSARWTRRIYFPAGTYRFTATMDDAMRIFVDGRIVLDYWYDSQEHTATGDINLAEGEHDVVVEYYEAGGVAVARVSWSQIGSNQPQVFYNWKGEYFTNPDLAGTPTVVRDDRYLSQNWGLESPIPGVIPPDNFSVRWSRTLTGPAGQYRITLTTDDGARLFVNGQLIINAWKDQAPTTYTADYFASGTSAAVVVEFYDRVGGAQIQVGYQIVPGGEGVRPVPPIGGGGGGQCPTPSGLQAVVSTTRLNVRSGPSTDFPVIGQLVLCQLVPLTGFRDQAGAWVQVIMPDGRTGWASASYLVLGTPMTNLTPI